MDRGNPVQCGPRRRSAHPDRIRAAIMVLEQFGRQELVEPLTKRVDTFDMVSWYLTTDCGTSACAAGILSLHPAFRRLGLRLNGCPVFDGAVSFEALAGLFDIDCVTAWDWFHPDNGAKGSQDVADIMRAYLRGIGEETGTVAPR